MKLIPNEAGQRLVEQLENGDVAASDDAIMELIGKWEQGMANLRFALDHARQMMLIRMHERGAIELVSADGRHQVTLDPGKKTLAWSELALVNNVKPLLTQDEWEQMVYIDDVPRVDHVFKVQSTSLRALGRRRGSPLRDAIEAALSESYDSAPTLRYERKS